MAEFFPSQKTSTRTPSEFDTICARKLAEALRQRRRVMRSVKIPYWAAKFRDLRLIDQIPQEKISKILSWYCTRIGEKFVPAAYSADSFRSKFFALEDAWERDSGKVVELSDEAKTIRSRIKDKHWPKGSDGQLGLTIQLSLDSYADFLRRHSETIHILQDNNRRSPQENRILTFAKHVSGQLSKRTTFVENWMLDVNASLQAWDSWQGDLTRMAFDYKAKAFRRIGTGWADLFCGDTSRWDLYLNYLTDKTNEH